MIGDRYFAVVAQNSTASPNSGDGPSTLSYRVTVTIHDTVGTVCEATHSFNTLVCDTASPLSLLQVLDIVLLVVLVIVVIALCLSKFVRSFCSRVIATFKHESSSEAMCVCMVYRVQRSLLLVVLTRLVVCGGGEQL